jgi:hypothetical protein
MTVIVKYRKNDDIKEVSCKYGNARPAVSGDRYSGSGISFTSKEQDKFINIEKNQIINIKSDSNKHSLKVKVYRDGSKIATGDTIQYNNGEFICGSKTFKKFDSIRERRK